MERNFIDWLKNYMSTQTLPGVEAHRTMTHKGRIIPTTMPETAKKSAVLLLLYPSATDYNLVLIERAKNGGSHSGQIAFPGGKVEEQDATLWDTALRESQEEISLWAPTEQVGALSPVYIPVSNFNLYPFVGFTPQAPPLQPSDDEVAQIIEVSLTTLWAKKEKRRIPLQQTANMYIDAWTYPLDDGSYIWGATAMVIAELEWLYKQYKELE